MNWVEKLQFALKFIYFKSKFLVRQRNVIFTCRQKLVKLVKWLKISISTKHLESAILYQNILPVGIIQLIHLKPQSPRPHIQIRIPLTNSKVIIHKVQLLFLDERKVELLREYFHVDENFLSMTFKQKQLLKKSQYFEKSMTLSLHSFISRKYCNFETQLIFSPNVENKVILRTSWVISSQSKKCCTNQPYS